MIPLRHVVVLALFFSGAIAMAEPVLDQLVSGYEFQSEDIQALQDDDFQNPGMLWVDEGKALFHQERGESGKSCRDCHEDVSEVVQTFPKRNHHTGRLENLTTQIQHCVADHQRSDAIGFESREALALSTYLRNQIHGEPVAHVDENLSEDLEAGREYYNRRKGQLNLACYHCHTNNAGKYLRGDLISQGHGNGYPIYRLEWQSVGSLHRRFRACDIGVRAEPPAFGSEEYIQLELYLKHRGYGLKVETPAVRR